jgi:hypothetical protein
MTSGYLMHKNKMLNCLSFNHKLKTKEIPAMYIKTIKSKNACENKLNLAFDVGKEKLDLYTEVADHSLQDCFDNHTLVIEQKLQEYHQIAINAGYTGINVIAEPTGVYHNKLFRIANKMGAKTAIVNPESVYKFKVIESNDTGKTDRKDCRVIFLLAKFDKTLIHRDINKEYHILRHLHAQYIDLENTYVGLRCKIYSLLEELFPDYSLSLNFIYSNSGRQMVKGFNANPYKIVKYGYSYFYKKMKKNAPRIRRTTLEKLYRDAQISVKYQLNPFYVTILESHFKTLWDDYIFTESNKYEVKLKMEDCYEQLRLSDPALPYPVKGVISKFRIAQILAETGPLSDFKSVNQLLRYAGINMRECQSGNYTGQNHISKKGRANLRRVLGYIVLPLVKKKALFGVNYHKKRDQGMPGNKAMVAMMRKFLKVFYGWYNSNEPFDIDRIFLNEQQYKQLKETVEV